MLSGDGEAISSLVNELTPNQFIGQTKILGCIICLIHVRWLQHTTSISLLNSGATIRSGQSKCVYRRWFRM